MRTLSSNELESIKAVQLEIMDEIHNICVENNITYYMIGGTLLGAVRHKGFIPWDLDIDIAMPRKDYLEFKHICSEKLKDIYQYHDFTTDDMYTRPHALVSRMNTLLKLKYDHLNEFNDNLGIYIDIFPLDNVPNGHEKRQKQANIIKKIKKIKYYRVPYSYSKIKIKRFMHKSLSLILSVISIKKLNQVLDKEMRRYEHEECECLCSMASQYSYWKQCMPNDIYGNPQMMLFEDRMYYGPAQPEEYLTRLYGDYMKLPSVEQQQKNLEVYQSVIFKTD